MASYTTPGVYVEEVSTLPPSVAEVSTAIPAFIGYTEKSGDLRNKPVRINTMLEFEELFGKASQALFNVSVSGDNITIRKDGADKFILYYSLKLYFDNGGGACYIISTGDFAATPVASDFEAALEALKKEDEPTLILLTDAVSLDKTVYYNLCKKALDQAAELKDRFLIVDVIGSDATSLRGDAGIGMNNLKYGAAYLPYLRTLIPYQYSDNSVTIVSDLKSYKQENSLDITYEGPGTPSLRIVKGTTAETVFTVTGTALEIRNVQGLKGKEVAERWKVWTASNQASGFDVKATGTGDAEVASVANAGALSGSEGSSTVLASKKDTNTGLYNRIKAELGKQKITLPPAAAMAGIYARTDRERGVWKAPANVTLNSVAGLTEKINDRDQSGLNIDATAGKSINVIRSFTGKGMVVWGARTLAGNDNEWRYVSVRRLFNLIEESIRKATSFAVFEPNDATTWLKVKAMADSYLYGLWQQGALAGPTPEAAYYVNVGLGKTMTAQDILEGRLIVDIGVAAVRPAEFIVIRFMHKLQEA